MCKEKYTYILTENGSYIKDNEKKFLLDVAEVAKLLNYYEKRLANCIEPKFKKGDYLYSAEKSGSQILLAEGYVTTITQLDDGSIWYHLSAKPHEFGVRETTCYKTMDEVHEVCQKLLKEIDNEQNNRKS